ncbi:hypothetical protein ACGGZK_18695 [Agromyces sp. MMS24-K17]|uniref:hypothetical protein n=1 Tax=Agromyces sp. MMS24-K17 TaxID=3372850 RepID=UPI0037552F32
MEDLRVEGEASESPHEIEPGPPEWDGLVGAVVASLVAVAGVIIGAVLVLQSQAGYAFQSMDASALLTDSVIAMAVAVGVPLAVIAWWGIRHRAVTRARRRHRWGPLVTACVCLALGLTSIFVVGSAVRRVEDAALVDFQHSLDVAEVEADAVDHLDWMARSLQLAAIGEPELTRESCVLADGDRGVAPTVVIRARTAGNVGADDLARVAFRFWQGDGYDAHTDLGQGMAYVSGVPLEDPYDEIMVIRDLPTPDVHELSYHAVCMPPAAR